MIIKTEDIMLKSIVSRC